MSDLTMEIAEILKKEEVKQGFNLNFVQNIPKLYPKTPKIVFDDGEWNEDDHPRDENGMFTTGEGSSGGNEVPADFRWGADKYQQSKEYANDFWKAQTRVERATNRMKQIIEKSKAEGKDPESNPEYQKLQQEREDWRTERGYGWGNMAYLHNTYEDNRERMDYFENGWRRENGGTVMQEEYKDRGMRALPVEKLDHPLSEKEIIDKLSGSDNTKGSCASLALSYIANKYGGMDVEDMRGSQSQDLFSQSSTIRNLSAQVEGAVVHSARSTSGQNSISAARQAMKSFKEGKEYYCGFGCHASMMKKEKGDYYYLEMQAARSGKNYIKGYDNGWQKVGPNTLQHRFGCQKRVSKGHAHQSFVVDAEKLPQSKAYQDALPYINTKRYARQEAKRKNKS